MFSAQIAAQIALWDKYHCNLSLTTCTCWRMDSTVVSNVTLKANISNIWYLIKQDYLKLNLFSCAFWGSVFSHARHSNNNLMPSSQWHETALDFSTNSLNKHDKIIWKKKMFYQKNGLYMTNCEKATGLLTKQALLAGLDYWHHLIVNVKQKEEYLHFDVNVFSHDCKHL